MSQRRTVGLYAALLLFFSVVVCRLYLLATNTEYAARAQNQIVTTLTLEQARGNFYDCDGQLLTGRQAEYYALCIPGEESYSRLFDFVGFSTQSVLYQKRNSAAPFLVKVEQDLSGQGIYTYQASRRYLEMPICVHLLGYLGSDGAGVAGLEAAFEETLAGEGVNSYVQCVTNGQGRLMEDTQPTLSGAEGTVKDVQLTISAPIQRACEGIASRTMTAGCILVLDTDTAKVRASVSSPVYDPENVGKSILANDTSLLNRAFCAYNVGSVFKPVLAAAALEEGLAGLTYECRGYVDVNGHIYRCAGGIPHGWTDLQSALEKSCNCYFIELGSRLGPERLEQYAQAFGFGQPVYLAGGLKAAEGNLPSVETLTDLGQQANFSFGQGALLASPVQLAGMVNAIAAGGEYRTPSFLERVLNEENGQTLQALYAPTERTVMTRQNAQALRAMLAAVVEEGIGKEAQPTYGSAAGKTGTAQTGRYNEAGEEYKDLWFVGFYPADAPKYTIVVMQDDKTAAEYSSAAIFAKVCDALYLLDESGGADKDGGEAASGETEPEKGAGKDSRAGAQAPEAPAF